MTSKRTRGGEEGQAAAAMVGLISVVMALVAGVAFSAIGQSDIQLQTTTAASAMQAAQAGVNDYQSWLAESAGGWNYATSFCSSGVTWPTGGSWPSAQCTGTNPDPNNPAFSALPDPNCTSDTALASAGTAGHSNYYGWDTIKGSTSSHNEQFQYVVDSRAATTTGGFVHLFVTGRTGTSGRYTCQSIKVDLSGPINENSNNKLVLPATNCSGTTVQVPAYPPGTAFVQVEATGGNGAAGGSGLLAFGGGGGGVGQTIEATYPVASVPQLYLTTGCQGGSTGSIYQGGAGFAAGGSVRDSGFNGGNAGGGGGATAICTTAACNASSQTSQALLNSNVLMIAGGGGGGGESFLVAGFGGHGGAGGNGTTGPTPGGTGGWGLLGAPGAGGASGSLSPCATISYTPSSAAGANGNKFFLGGDGGAGGAGYVGGCGGQVGYSGGGGGGGSSWVNTTGFAPTPGSILYNPGGAPNYGQATFTYLNGAGGVIGVPVSPATCGIGGQQTVPAPVNATIQVTIAGGGGGGGSSGSLLALLFGGGGAGGSGTQIVASFTTGSAPGYLTAIQGCAGVIGADDGGDPGGFGLGNGGYNVPAGSGGGHGGASGSGGGASALLYCTTLVAGNCPATSPDVLLVAGGGGGGGATANGLLCEGGAGGGAGGGTAAAGTVGIQNGTAGGYSGGAGGSTTYAPNGGTGTYNAALGDGAGGGGGFGGGGGGVSTCLNILGIGLIGNGPGGGGGSSDVVTSAGTGASAVNLVQSAGKYATVWSKTQPGQTGSLAVTETSALVSGVVDYENPTATGSVTW